MKKDFAGAVLTATEFSGLAAMCAADPSFPKSFEAWAALVREGEAMARAADLPVEQIAVNVEFFSKWCRVTGVSPCLQALRAMLIVEREGAHQGLKAFKKTDTPSVN